MVIQYVEHFTKTVYLHVRNGQRIERKGDAYFYINIAGTPRVRNVPEVVRVLAERAVQGKRLLYRGLSRGQADHFPLC